MPITITIGTWPTAQRISVATAGQFKAAATALGVPVMVHSAPESINQRDAINKARRVAK